MSYNYNFNRKEMSAEEIASRMDFGEVLSNYKIVTKPFYKTGWFATTMIVAVTGTIALILMTSSPDEKKSETQTTKNEKTITYKEDSPCIKPPQKNADLPFSSYQIENSTGGTFQHSSGSEINIPANSFFVDGKPVEGKVEIRYREFRDQADFILSGIPMTYDSAGKQYHFESAGMLEIRAFKDNQPVDFKGEVDVNFASDYNDTKYNFYQLDEKDKNWVCLGKDEVVSEEIKPNNGTDPKKEIQKEIKVKEDLLVEVKTEIKSLKNSEPEKPIKLDRSNFNFTLDVLAEEFPELSSFSTQRFEVNPSDRNFTNKTFDTEWENIKMEKDPKTDQLRMKLTKGTQTKSFEVYPVYDGKDYTSAKEKFEKEFKEYSAKLESREQEEAKLEKELAELRAISKKNSHELNEQWAEKRRQQNEFIPTSTASLSPSEMADQTKRNNIRAVGGLLRTENYKYDRKLKLPSMGVFNCDSPVSLPIAAKGKKHRFQFKNKDGISLGMMIIYVLEKKRNVMFTYQPEDFENIKMSEEGENTIVGITPEGYVAVALPVDLKTVNWEEKILDVKMQVFEAVKDPAELKKILNPNS